MRLLVNTLLVLVLAVTWTTADPSPGPEECNKFDILNDTTQILGRLHMMAAYTHSGPTKALLGLTSSLWSNVTAIESGLRVFQFQKMNGTCHESRFNMTVDGDTATALMYGVTAECQLLTFSNTSLIMYLKASSQNITTIIEKFHLDPDLDQGSNQPTDQDPKPSEDPSDKSRDQTIQNLYLSSREAELSDTELQKFKEYAKCLGFTGEPDFIHKSSQEYCSEEESVLIQ